MISEIQIYDRIVPIKENDEDFGLYVNKILKLPALEIQFLDADNELRNFKFKYEITDFTDS